MVIIKSHVQLGLEPGVGRGLVVLMESMKDFWPYLLERPRATSFSRSPRHHSIFNYNSSATSQISRHPYPNPRTYVFFLGRIQEPGVGHILHISRCQSSSQASPIACSTIPKMNLSTAILHWIIGISNRDTFHIPDELRALQIPTSNMLSRIRWADFPTVGETAKIFRSRFLPRQVTLKRFKCL